ncbi:unnamed protein product [Candidula unifasciata]|uniref:Uncharacterized protein n=1 Tax=Candidula unifasciata TaxID=100452 RepID=A0A8S3YZW6_9EUPU|nr:unnamed protein product [Candidula unifasciata]
MIYKPTATMGKKSASVILFLFMVLHASCQNKNIAEVGTSTLLVSDMETTISTPDLLIGNSKKDHPQQDTRLTTQQSIEIGSGGSTGTVTNQVFGTTASTHTAWTTPLAEPLTGKWSARETIVVSTQESTANSFIIGSTRRIISGPTEGFTAGPTELSMVISIEGSTLNPTDPHTNTLTTDISKGQPTENVHETSLDYPSDIPAKQSTDKYTEIVTYQPTNTIELDSSEHFTEWQGGTLTEYSTGTLSGTSSQLRGDESIVTSSLTPTASQKYTLATATYTPTEKTTLPVIIEQSTELIAASSFSEQSTEAAPASLYTEHSRQPVTESSYTEQYIEPTTASSDHDQSAGPTNTSSLSEQSTSVHNITQQPIDRSSEATSANPQNETAAGNIGASNDDWKIAVGVVIPLALLIAVLVGVYICYRKKYPVRMIIGREFGKFSNPNYHRRGHTPSLVREDADFIFSNNRTSTSIPSQEFNPVNKKIMYDNMGFVKDDNDDEDEQERKFLKNKSWLFKNASDESKNKAEEDADMTAESSFIANSSTAVEPKLDANRNETNTSKDMKQSKAVADHETTPVIMPRRKKKAPEPPGNKAPFPQSNNESNRQPATIQITSETKVDISKSVGSSLPRNIVLLGTAGKEPLKHTNSDNEIPKNVKSGVQLFQQTVLNQIKERSRSLTLDPAELDGRSRSFSVDQPSSTRKMSLYDEIVEATRLRFLAAQKMTSSVSEQVSPVIAFVVGADFRDRDISVASSALSADDDTAHDDGIIADYSASWTQSKLESKPATGVDVNPNERPTVKQTNFEEISQQESNTSLRDVDTSHEDENKSSSDNTGHYNSSTSYRLLSDSRDDEEINESKETTSSKIPDNAKSTDMTSVLLSGAAPEDNSYQDDMDSAIPGAFSSTNIGHNHEGVLKRKTSLTSESSSSEADQEGTKLGYSNVAYISDLDIPPTKNTNSDETDAEENGFSGCTTKTLSPADENDHRYLENDMNEDNSIEASKQSLSESRQKFKLMSPEMKNSGSSTESVAGSSESSRGIPSDDEEEEDLDMYFPTSVETPNTNQDNDNIEDVIDSSPLGINQPFLRLHQGDNADDPTSPTADNNYSQKVIFQTQYSNSSSDSSDFPPSKAVNLLSSKSQISTDVAQGASSPAVTSTKKDPVETASQDQFEDRQGTEESGSYTLLDYLDDADVDV